jgi:SAM-dependent methyltransferase
VVPGPGEPLKRGAVYDSIGTGYTRHRRPDPRIAATIQDALGDARTVVNVGAGAGAYEPSDRWVIAVEPSQAMIAQRPPGSAPALRATADALPLADRTVDAAMTVLSLHHWPDWRAGVAELRRVARHRVVVLTWDKHAGGFWLTNEYFDWLAEWDARRFPAMDELVAELPGATVTPVPIPGDCSDGILGAYYGRPEAYLDPDVRQAISIFAQAPDPDRVAASLRTLGDDLRSGAWDARHGALRDSAGLDVGYRLITAELTDSSAQS